MRPGASTPSERIVRISDIGATIQPDRPPFLDGAHRCHSKPLSLDCLPIRRVDSVALAFHSIDEISVFPNKRVSLRAPHRSPLTHVDHQLMLAELDRETL